MTDYQLLTVLLLSILTISLFLLVGVALFAYWLGYRHGEMEGFDTGRNYQILKDRADNLHSDQPPEGFVYLN